MIFFAVFKGLGTIMVIFARIQTKLVIILQRLKLSVKYLIPMLVLLFAGAPARAQYDKDAFLFRGIQSLSDGKYARSIEELNVLTRLDTTDYKAFFFRGVAKYNLGDVRGARRDFTRAVRLNPVYTSAYHYKAITESRFGEYDKALEDLQTAISLRPGLNGLYFSRGVTYFLSQQFDKAVADFNRYIRKEPKDPSAYLNRGASYLFLADTTRAMEDYDKAISLDRYEPEGYIRRGRLLFTMGRTGDALADLDKAISLDSTSTFAFFNRALMRYEDKDYNGAMADLDRVLREEPGNALTLYNRSLIHAQLGNFEEALSDMDRVIGINPRNVLAYYNRASYFIQMERWQDAEEDLDRAIELYPDFAKAYMARSFVLTRLGRRRQAVRDYETARQKVREYRTASSGGASFADTTRKYNSLIALDADFAKKDFDDELLQHRDIDIRLRPMYKFVLSDAPGNVSYALRYRYDNPLVDRFIASAPVPVTITNSDSLSVAPAAYEDVLFGAGDGRRRASEAQMDFLRALWEIGGRQFNSALNYYDKAADALQSDKYEQLYQAFYLMNRGVLRAEMIDFIASIETNVQTLSMDDAGTARARVKDQVMRSYDYSEALNDMIAAALAVGDLPYIQFNLGNLYCLSSKLVEAIDSYSRAIELYPYMGDAYYNRGLVLIYLKDKEKGCIDLSHAGELGVGDAYGVIKRYCEEETVQ